jgi:5,10-methenyltetrahydromethanopterin hydrogenase
MRGTCPTRGSCAIKRNSHGNDDCTIAPYSPAIVPRRAISLTKQHHHIRDIVTHVAETLRSANGRLCFIFCVKYVGYMCDVNSGVASSNYAWVGPPDWTQKCLKAALKSSFCAGNLPAAELHSTHKF